jgi:hypothetical protein
LNQGAEEEFLDLIFGVFSKNIFESSNSILSEGFKERLAGVLSLLFIILAFGWKY